MKKIFLFILLCTFSLIACKKENNEEIVCVYPQQTNPKALTGTFVQLFAPSSPMTIKPRSLRNSSLPFPKAKKFPSVPVAISKSKPRRTPLPTKTSTFLRNITKTGTNTICGNTFPKWTSRFCALTPWLRIQKKKASSC